MNLRHAAALALVGWYLIVQPGDASSASTSNAPASDQITVVGCWSKVDESYGLSGVESFTQYVREVHSRGGAPSNDYRLAGDTSKLDNLGPLVRISGTFLPNGMGKHPVGTIKVETVTELSAGDATLNPSIGRTSSWRKYRDSANGVAYSLPDAFPRTDLCCPPQGPNFVGHTNTATLAGFLVPNDSWGASDFAAGSFAIYVTPEITNAADCYKFGQSYPDDKVSSESISGVRYSHLLQSGIPPEEIDLYHAFENGRCYEIAMDFTFYRMGGFDLGCAFSAVDPNSLIKLVLPQISFYKP
ncbi:hypothetical protein [Candidatus Binatus sp.]|uniref:hypothetical protein n=2 Tax=Candidatus Binatus sp. TaxID=2811406 RepID=UPI003BAF72DB